MNERTDIYIVVRDDRPVLRVYDRNSKTYSNVVENEAIVSVCFAYAHLVGGKNNYIGTLFLDEAKTRIFGPTFTLKIIWSDNRHYNEFGTLNLVPNLLFNRNCSFRILA